MGRKDNNYFKMLEEQVGYCVRAAALLEEILGNVTQESIGDYCEQMHALEHRADELHHDILTRLLAEFITPIDREDILQLVQIVDDITDALDEVVINFYMFCAKRVPPHALDMCALVKRCVGALLSACGELHNFKKPGKLRGELIEVNTAESEADACYIEAVHALFSGEADARTLLCDKAIYDNLEQCCDLCEHAADVIAHIVIKNT